MASIWKHPEAKFYFARFKDVTGKWRNKTTRCTDARKASRIADGFEAAARTRQTVRHIRDSIAALQKEVTGETLAFHSLSEFAESWLTSKTPEVAPGTLAFYRNAVAKFTAWRQCCRGYVLTYHTICSFRRS